MKKIAALALIALLPVAAQAGVIIDNSTGGWYNSALGDMEDEDAQPGGFLLGPNVSEGDPTVSFPVAPAFNTPAALGAGWLSGVYNANWGIVADIPNTWTVNDETAIVYNFTLATASSLHIDLGVDNGILVWLNGSYLFGAQSGGGSSLSEYDIDLASLAAGNYSLQILREDHGGATGFDIQVDATAVRAVPEPATLALVGMGLLGLGMVRRRRRG